MSFGLFCKTILNRTELKGVPKLRGVQSFSYATDSCSAKRKTHPIDESAKAIRHLQFTRRLPFEKGLEIQEQFSKAQLDIKELHAKIRRRLAKLQEENVNMTINDSERQIIDNILSMKPNPIVLTFEFDPTYTGGKRIKKTMTPEQIAQFESFVPSRDSSDARPKFVQVERGGQITYHGPGQMVAYVIMDLKSFDNFPARCFVSGLEDSVISTLKNLKVGDGQQALDIDAKLTEETGVWTVDNKKIASLGIHVRRSVTSHGVSINVNPDLSYMTSFEMCGLPGVLPTSVEKQRPDVVLNVQDVAVKFVNELAKTLGVSTVERMQLDDMDLKA
ncbi:ZYRO0C04488p [Zygosaccharomyces rouxii]|uniref:Octanoyltransferase n=1 Tax=Zygosaccharomyces rouxii (strain ATCC 2623 / CBS 732 / NBRC 1130 / NCYC 568 / NRRL Y-229) TaxID=559307 RepID=C5DT09_ZYGRC|nr:uncharacterized protein ZYRO0C04488g [Zygosaccharomyces rouxii]KAH9201891.1 hypothetical protein LQ764DRAFT_89604 [Zygosaccharomyces rouxii]CAR26920.1 ZYRO0C04488p [Zygosaccharomyces rouxii]